MAWKELKDANVITLLQKLSTLQVKLTELVAKRKSLDVQMKVKMLGGTPHGK